MTRQVKQIYLNMLQRNSNTCKKPYKQFKNESNSIIVLEKRSAYIFWINYKKLLEISNEY